MIAAVAIPALAAACGGDSVPAGTAATVTQRAVISAANPSDFLAGDVDRGRRRFATEACGACHSTGSNRVVGPGLAGISARGDDAYIRQSVKEPGAVVVNGFPNVMSDFSRLDDQTVEDLIAYLKTLN